MLHWLGGGRGEEEIRVRGQRGVWEGAKWSGSGWGSGSAWIALRCRSYGRCSRPACAREYVRYQEDGSPAVNEDRAPADEEEPSDENGEAAEEEEAPAGDEDGALAGEEGEGKTVGEPSDARWRGERRKRAAKLPRRRKGRTRRRPWKRTTRSDERRVRAPRTALGPSPSGAALRSPPGAC